jgi:hypothetical protein
VASVQLLTRCPAALTQGSPPDMRALYPRTSASLLTRPPHTCRTGQERQKVGDEGHRKLSSPSIVRMQGVYSSWVKLCQYRHAGHMPYAIATHHV